MEDTDALAILAALAQETRLNIVRRLVRAAPEAVAAGDLAADLGVPAATLSFHLSQLDRAGLVRATRQGRSILYAVETGTLRGLLAFLTEDCCQGRPEICNLSSAGPGCAPAVKESAS